MDDVKFTEFIVERMEVLDESTRVEFIFYLNGTRIIVSIFQRNNQPDDEEEKEYIENHLIELLEAATDSELELYEPEDNKLFETSVDEAANIIMKIGEIPFSLLRHSKNISNPLRTYIMHSIQRHLTFALKQFMIRHSWFQ
jgi:hypothetical protein